MAKKDKRMTTEITEEALTGSVLPTMTNEDPEINAGLKVSVQEVLQAREDRKSQNAKMWAARDPNRITRQKILADTPYGIRFLHDFDKGIELLIHCWKGDEPIHEICKVHYGEDCDICKIEGTKFGLSYAIPSKCFIGYVYNNVGQTFEKANHKGELQVYPLKPIKVIEIPLGKDECNLMTMKEASYRKYFMEDIWVIERKKGKGFSVPRTIPEAEFRAKVGREINLNLPDEAEKFADKSKKDLLKLILQSFDNVEWAKLGFLPPGAKEADAPEVAEKDQTNSSREYFQ
jgi:hypothetical protein